MPKQLTNIDAGCIAIFLLFAIAVPPALGQAYPSRPIRLVTSFPPGGATDILARIMAQKLGAALGQSVVVENKPGAGGSIGGDAVAKAAPDGHTLLISGSSTFSTGRALGSKQPFDTVKDFAPFIHLINTPRVLVVSVNQPYKTVRELIAAAKAKPGVLNYGSNGNGSVGHLSTEAFKLAANVDIAQIPYKGTALAFTDLATGQISMMFDNIMSVQPGLKTGKIRALGITSATRSALMPDVPTMIEGGLPGFIDETHFGLFAPAATPAVILARLNAESNKILQSSEMKEQLAQQGALPVGGTPQEYVRYIANDTARWSKIVKEAGIKPE